jgi:hypothetical protein
VFSFVYDQFWAAPWAPSIGDLALKYLGQGYRQNPNLWTYYVAPQKGAGGWPPHTDSGRVDRLTVWIPLTDTSVDNGCIYVIPRDRMPACLPQDFHAITAVNWQELTGLLHSVRALPARAASALGGPNRSFTGDPSQAKIRRPA